MKHDGFILANDDLERFEHLDDEQKIKYLYNLEMDFQWYETEKNNEGEPGYIPIDSESELLSELYPDLPQVQLSFIESYAVIGSDNKNAVNTIKDKLFTDGFILREITNKQIKNKYKLDTRYCACYEILSFGQSICPN